MKQKYIIIVSILLLIAPFLTFVINFHNFQLSTNVSDWGDFGLYINGSLIPLITLIGIYLSYLLHNLGLETRKAIRDRQEMEQRPLLHISYVDYNNHVRIKLCNKGIGPAIIKRYELIDKCQGKKHNSFFTLLDEVNINYFTYYSDNQKEVILSPLEEVKLFEQKINTKKKNQLKDLKKIRELLKNIEINITYTNLYKDQEFVHIRSLAWFGRNI